MPRSIGVSKIPGAMVHTRIASRERSRATGSVMPTTPPFDAEYAAWPIWPSKAATEAVLTITPRSPAAFGCPFAIATDASRIMLKVPTRLMLITRANEASTCGPSFFTVRSAIAMPAQLTRPLRDPKAFTVWSTTACPSDSEVTSHFAKRTLAPSSFASASPFSACRSAIATLAPFAASMRTVPSPRPDAPPVTMNVLPLICIETSLGLLDGFLLLRQELRAVAQQRIERRLRHEVGPAFELFLALDLVEQLLATLVEILVLLRLVLGLLVLLGRACLGRLPGDREPNVIVRFDRLADLHRVSEVVEGLRLYRHRMVEPGVDLVRIGDDVDQVHPAKRTGEIGRLLQVGRLRGALQLPVHPFRVPRHGPALRRGDRLRPFDPQEVLHQPVLRLGFDLQQRVAEREHRLLVVACQDVAAARVRLGAPHRS